jgi:hypothetical protein
LGKLEKRIDIRRRGMGKILLDGRKWRKVKWSWRWRKRKMMISEVQWKP